MSKRLPLLVAAFPLSLPSRSAIRFVMAVALSAAGVPAFAGLPTVTNEHYHEDVSAIEIRGAVNVLGYDDVRANSGGSLVFRQNDLVFSTSRSSGSIPYSAIREVTIEHSNKGLLRGTGGAFAESRVGI